MNVRALHVRLAAALLVLLLLAGALNLYSTLVTTDLYLQEVTQSANLDLAHNVARSKHQLLLGRDGELLGEGIEELLHWMMVVHPGPHFYLLDLRGEILAWDPAAGDPVEPQVDRAPIREFLAYRESRQGGGEDRPARIILGDDPRDPARRKVFSAAPIPPRGIPRGYLYIVLDSQPVGSVPERLKRSYILRLSTRNGLAYLAVVLLSGVLVFGLLTRPLRQLVGKMQRFLRPESQTKGSASPAPDDEVRSLEQAFREMTGRIEEQMAEIERMSGLQRELIANVSHDLRTPITLLQGYLETLALKTESVSPQEREEYLQISLRQSQRLGKLVEELFELTKLDAREVEPVMERFRIAELVQDNVQRFQLAAEREGIRLRADFDPDVPPVFVDVGLMERALENLLENALRYTPRGGAVTVELREEIGRLSVRVVDTGCGISEDDLPHIFDRYYRSRLDGAAGRGGSGLGLAITRRIVELHGSTLDVESTVGRGSIFSFSLSAAPRTHEMILPS